DGRPEETTERADDEAVRRSCDRGAALESTGVRTWRNRTCAGRTRDLGRVGGFRGAARSGWRLSPRSTQTLREIRIRVRPLRTLRPGLHPYADRFRSRIGGRDREVPTVHGRRQLTRRLVRWILVR